MELTITTHYVYDAVGRYFYFTVAGAELATGIDELDNIWTDAQRRLKNQGKQLKELMSLATNDNKMQRCSRRDFVEYMQWNDDDSRQAVLYMLSEFAEASYDDDLDRAQYDSEETRSLYQMLPMTMKSRGSDSAMLYLGETIFTVPEDEYRVGY